MSEKHIKKNLNEILTQGGDDNFMIMAADEYYIQFNAGKRAEKMYIDAVSNAHLMENDKLSDEQNTKFEGLGFDSEGGKENFGILVENPTDNIDKILKITKDVMEIYGLKQHKYEFEVSLD